MYEQSKVFRGYMCNIEDRLCLVPDAEARSPSRELQILDQLLHRYHLNQYNIPDMIWAPIPPSHRQI